MEKKHKNLEFIQATIVRMGVNSFLIKGWAVTLIAALFALAARDLEMNYILISCIPLIMFWALDAYYLSQERKYRDLYSEVANKDEEEITYSMDASTYKKGNRWRGTAFSKTILIFYLGLTLTMFLAYYLISCI